jgi:hypothetical protein
MLRTVRRRLDQEQRVKASARAAARETRQFRAVHERAVERVTIKEKFGAWTEALKEAGLEMMEDGKGAPFVYAVDREDFNEWVKNEQAELDETDRSVAAKEAAALDTSTSAQRAVAKDTVREAHVSERAPSVNAEALKAEIAALKAALWKEKDKLAQLSIFLVDKPQPKAEDRPPATRVWPLSFERRPKDIDPLQIQNPDVNDPAFALRKEEFEQWLVRRKEQFETKFQARQEELEKSFDAKVKARIEAQLAKEETRGRVFTEAQFKSIWRLSTC